MGLEANFDLLDDFNSCVSFDFVFFEFEEKALHRRNQSFFGRNIIVDDELCVLYVVLCG